MRPFLSAARLGAFVLLVFPLALACATYKSDGEEDVDSAVFKPGDKDASVDLSDGSVKPEPDAGLESDAGADAGVPDPPWSVFTGAMTTDGAMLWSGVSRTWVPTPAPTELATRGMMCAATDREGRAIFFGGHNAGGKSGADLFRFNGARWDVLRASVGFPPGRSGGACFVHPTTGEFFLFGGIGYDGANPGVYLADSWKWDGTSTTWAQLSASPWGNSVAPGYALDTKRKLLVMRGGGASSGRHRESYDWTGSAWTLWASSNTDDYTSSLAIAYHGKREVTMRLGGLNPGNAITDVCQLSNVNSNGWTPCSGTISARYGHAMAYDPVDQKIVVFGGVNSVGAATQDTWTWDGTWTSGSGGAAPPPKSSASFTYVASLQKLILVGGF